MFPSGEEVRCFPFFFLIQLVFCFVFFLTLVRHAGAKAQDTDGDFMPNGYRQGGILSLKTKKEGQFEPVVT